MGTITGGWEASWRRFFFIAANFAAGIVQTAELENL